MVQSVVARWKLVCCWRQLHDTGLQSEQYHILLFQDGFSTFKMDLALVIMTMQQNYLKTTNMKSLMSK